MNRLVVAEGASMKIPGVHQISGPYAGMLLGPPAGAIGVSLTGTYAASFFLGAFVILPAAWGLGVATGGGVPGLWWAWTAGYGAACVALAGAVATSDWEALADAAVARHAAPLLKEEIT